MMGDAGSGDVLAHTWTKSQSSRARMNKTFKVILPFALFLFASFLTFEKPQAQKTARADAASGAYDVRAFGAKGWQEPRHAGNQQSNRCGRCGGWWHREFSGRYLPVSVDPFKEQHHATS